MAIEIRGGERVSGAMLMAPLLLLLAPTLVAGCSLDKAEVPRRLDAGEPDAGPLPPSTCMGCDPFVDDACADGESCYITTSGLQETGCQTEGSGGLGEACSGWCAPGHSCSTEWGCLETCRPGSRCSGNRPCVVWETLEGPGCVGFCADACSVIDETGCPDDRTCDVFFGDPLDNHCRFAGGATEGTPCDRLSDCAPGFTCTFDLGATALFCTPLLPCADASAVCPGRDAQIGFDEGRRLCVCQLP